MISSSSIKVYNKQLFRFQHDTTYKSDLFIELVPLTHLNIFSIKKILLYILILYVTPLTAFVASRYISSVTRLLD